MTRFRHTKSYLTCTMPAEYNHEFDSQTFCKGTDKRPFLLCFALIVTMKTVGFAVVKRPGKRRSYASGKSPCLTVSGWRFGSRSALLYY